MNFNFYKVYGYFVDNKDCLLEPTLNFFYNFLIKYEHNCLDLFKEIVANNLAIQNLDCLDNNLISHFYVLIIYVIFFYFWIYVLDAIFIKYYLMQDLSVDCIFDVFAEMCHLRS